MPSSTVTLGGVTLQGHEVPEKIPFGGRQRLVKQRLVGGRRRVDAMGPEEGDRRWEGRFRGPTALSRARAVDAMRQRGAQVDLSWGGLRYRVVIEEFEADYRRSTDIPYRIECVVLDDDAPAAGDLPGAIDQLVGGDLSAVLGLGSLLGADPLAALGAFQSAIGGVAGSLADLEFGALLPIQDLAAAAETALDDAVSAGDLAIAAFDMLDPTTLAAPELAAAIGAQADALEAQSAAATARGLCGRIVMNLDTIPG